MNRISKQREHTYRKAYLGVVIQSGPSKELIQTWKFKNKRAIKRRDVSLNQ